MGAEFPVEVKLVAVPVLREVKPQSTMEEKLEFARRRDEPVQVVRDADGAPLGINWQAVLS